MVMENTGEQTQIIQMVYLKMLYGVEEVEELLEQLIQI